MKKIKKYSTMKREKIENDIAEILKYNKITFKKADVVGKSLYIYLETDYFISNARRIIKIIDEYVENSEKVNTRYQLINK